MLQVAIKEILTQLSDLKKHTLYSFHMRYRLSPTEISLAIKELEDKGIIQKTGKVVRLLNQNLNSQQLNEISKIYNTDFQSIMLDKKYFDQQSQNKLGINDLYLPITNLLDKSLLDQ